MHTFKNNFEIPCEEIAAFDYYKYGLRISHVIYR